MFRTIINFFIRDKLMNESSGIISYLDFIDVVQIKSISKDFNNIMLPNNAVLKLDNYKLNQLILNELETNKYKSMKSQYIIKLIVPHTLSNKTVLNKILPLLTNMKELELSCVCLTGSISDINDDIDLDEIDKDTILENEYLYKFSNLNTLTVIDSYVNRYKLAPLKFEIIKRHTSLKCYICGSDIHGDFQVLLGHNYWYMYNFNEMRCDRCDMKSRSITLYRDMCIPTYLIPVIDKRLDTLRQIDERLDTLRQKVENELNNQQIIINNNF